MRIERVVDCLKHGYWVRVLCRCGNNAFLDPRKLITKDGRVTLTTEMDDLFEILRCRVCKARPYDIHFTLRPER